ncbi:MAG: glycosyltransferase family 4 protein [Candidatus Omnitrophica bacterium]|nr:glycosyltransferase family 4 protein [Candidatus Omnitrophota bacterium]
MFKINLLYVITKLELGGAQKQLLSLINNLDKKKYNIFLFTAKNGLLIKEALSIAGLTLEKSKFLERLINPLKDVLALVEIYCFIKKNRIQIVHTHSSKAGILGRLAAKLAKTPIIIHTVHGWSFNDYQPVSINYLYVFLEKICAAFTSKIIVVSRFDKDKGLKNLIGRKNQYVLIRYGLDARGFKDTRKRNEARKSLGLGDADLVVGMAACFKPQKAPLDFIELASLIKRDFPDTKFVLVGDGQLRKRIDARIKQLNLDGQVILTGWRNDIGLILTGLDVFVLTSLWEGLPIVVLEAMAAGAALVATDTGGIAEVVINGKGGYLVKPHDIRSMRNRLGELLNSVQKRDEFVRRSREAIGREEFLLSSMFKNTAELYSNLLEESKNV